MSRLGGLGKLLLLGASAGALGVVPLGAASASCAGPVLRADQAEAPSATPVVLGLRTRSTVSGTWFHSGCDDTGQGSGCGRPDSEEAPLEDVGLVLEQGPDVATLGTADAASSGKRYSISWSVQVPAGFSEGPAVLRAAGAVLPVELRAQP